MISFFQNKTHSKFKSITQEPRY